MKKKFLGLAALMIFALGLTACGDGGGTSSSENSQSQNITIAKTFTVAFEVDGERYQTCRVKEGKTITDTVRDPQKSGFTFDGWFEENTKVDLATYVVTKDVTFTAKFTEILDENLLSVNDVKEEGKEYYMVFGWWEVNDPAEPDKVTSGMTEDSARLFYENVIMFLEAKGATKTEIESISFRNYSSATVAEMGTAINADGDVDIMIGVGANIFTTAQVLPYNTSDDSKFQTKMGTADKARYVALIQGASDIAKTTYEWLDSEVGHKSFLEN